VHRDVYSRMPGNSGRVHRSVGDCQDWVTPALIPAERHAYLSRNWWVHASGGHSALTRVRIPRQSRGFSHDNGGASFPLARRQAPSAWCQGHGRRLMQDVVPTPTRRPPNVRPHGPLGTDGTTTSGRGVRRRDAGASTLTRITCAANAPRSAGGMCAAPPLRPDYTAG